jgi:hypothetical protein
MLHPTLIIKILRHSDYSNLNVYSIAKITFKDILFLRNVR